MGRVSALAWAELSLESSEERLTAARSAIEASPLDPELRSAFEAAEGEREQRYAKASRLWNDEQGREYTAQWGSCAYGPDVNPVA